MSNCCRVGRVGRHLSCWPAAAGYPLARVLGDGEAEAGPTTTISPVSAFRCFTLVHKVGICPSVGRRNVEAWEGEKEGQGKSRRTHARFNRGLQRSIDELCRLLPKYGPWEAELEQQLGRLHVFPHHDLVHQILKRRKSNPAVAWRFLHWAKAQGYRSNTSDYYTLLASFLGDSQFQTVQTLLEEMLLDGHPMMVNVFRILLAALAKGQKAEQAVEALSQMEFFDCQPDKEVYWSLDRATRRSGLSLLPFFLQHLARYGPDCLSDFFRILHLRRQLEDACALYRQAREKAWALDDIGYGTLVAILIEADCEEEARDLHVEMVEKGLYKSGQGKDLVIRSMCSIAGAEELGRLVQELEELGPDLRPRTWICMIQALARVGMLREALELYQAKRSVGYAFKHLKTYNTMLQIFCKALVSNICGVNVVLEIWQGMKQRAQPTMDTCSLVIHILGREAVGDEMIRVVYQEITSMSFDILLPQIYDTLIYRLCRMGKVGDAGMLWKEMQEKNMTTSFARDCIAQIADAPMEEASG